MSETALVPAPIKTLVIGKADLASYRDTVLAEARHKLAEEEARLAEAERAVALAEEMLNTAPGQARSWRYRRTRFTRTAESARRYLKAVESGYLPIPRLPVVNLKYTERVLPADALEALKEARDTGSFEWFGVIDGSEASRWGWPSRRRANRDPILVGVINGEPFPLAWWR